MNNKKWLAEQILSINDNAYMSNHFYNILYQICINRFIWKNVPSQIDVDFIERELANNGELAFIDNAEFGFMVTHCVGDELNLYGRPTNYLCWSANNIVNKYYKAEDIVIIRNNKLSQPSRDFIQRYASTLGEIKKVKEVNLNAQKTPILISCEESQLLTMKNMYADYEGNAPVIFSRRMMDEQGIGVFKTDAPYLLDKLQEEFISNLNECLTFQGINTTPFKKERMVTDEVNANNDMVNICLSLFLETRLQAIEQINEKFGLNISLELAEYCKNEISKEKSEDDKNE